MISKNQIINDIDIELDKYLTKAKYLPEGIIFNNNGLIDLFNLRIIPKNVQFNNEGIVYLNKNIILGNLNYKELLKLSEKLKTKNSYFLDKEDIKIIIRELKLNSILNE